MEISITLQAVQATLAFVLGVGLGLVYDFVKAFRLRIRTGYGTAILDVFYCVSAALCLFTFGLGAGEGQLRLFMLIAVGLGASVYALLLSKTALAVFGAFAATVAATVRPLYAILKKSKAVVKKRIKIAKNIFQKNISWFTIKRSYKYKPHYNYRSGRSEGFETEKGKYVYEDCNLGLDSLRGDKPRLNTRKGCRGRSKARRTPAAGRRDDTVQRRA